MNAVTLSRGESAFAAPRRTRDGAAEPRREPVSPPDARDAGTLEGRTGDDVPEDDWRLLAAARHSARAFGELFERHRDYVHRVAWGVVGSALAEDVTQEVFVRLLARRRPWLRRARFSTLLFRITVNTSRELARRAGRELPVTDEREILLRSDPAPGPEQRLDATDLERALRTLTERQREVVVLRHLEGLSTRETSRVLRCSEGSIKTHLHRGLEQLRQALS